MYDKLTPNTFAHSDKGTGDKIFVFIACVFLGLTLANLRTFL